MDTKEKILQISFSIFLNKGYKNTTMNDLIIASGLSKGAFYHYFKNKEALYFEVINTFFLSYFKKVNWDNFDALKFEQIETGMKLFYTQFVNEINEHSEKGLTSYYTMFFQAYEYHPDFAEEIKTFYLQLENKINNAFKKENITDKKAISIIAKYEGILFWLSIFRKDKIEILINDI